LTNKKGKNKGLLSLIKRLKQSYESNEHMEVEEENDNERVKD
jgi:hypothetical protein